MTDKKATFLALSLLALALSAGVCTPALALTAQENNEIANAVRTSSGKWMVAEGKARTLTAAKKYDQAAALYQDVLTQRTALGLDLQTEQLALADLLEKQGQTAGAETMLKQAISGRELSAGDENLTLIYSLESYAAFLARNKRPAEAAKVKQRIVFINNQVGKAPKELLALIKSAPTKTSPQYAPGPKKHLLKPRKSASFT